MNRPFSFFTITPFKIGCLVILCSSLLYFSFGDHKPHLLQRFDNQIYDAMFRWRGTTPTTKSVVIVDIDEKSLSAIGQWPWPRDTVAQLLRTIADNGAKVIGLDIVFAEEDNTSPKHIGGSFEKFLAENLPDEATARLKTDKRFDHDLIMGEVVSQTPTVLGYVFQTVNDGLKNESDKPFPSINIDIKPSELGFDELTMPTAYRAIVNVPDIAMAETEGFFNVFPDPAGTVRKVPLLIMLDGVPYPSLVLEMLRTAQNIPQITIHASHQSDKNYHSILGISLGNQFIHTDSTGQVTVNYRGPGFTFPYVSASDLLQGKHMEQLKDAYVLVGTSAAGLLDLRATPFSNVYPGAEVHASVIDNLLNNDPFEHDIFTEIGLTYTVIIVGGLSLTALLSYSSPLIGGFGGMTLIVLCLFYGNYQQLFLNHQLAGITYPLATIFTIFLFVTLFNYFFKDREKRFVQGAFGHYVSPDVVKELITSPEKLSLAGHEKVITIFFNDIRGFTSISERMDSKQLGLFMNEYLTAMSSVIMENKGTVDKFIGDAIMALWGAPLDDDDHAANAVRASLQMMQTLHKMRAVWAEQGLPPIDIGIGLNTGMVSVGNFGSNQRFDYTVIGDNVNLASRLEGLNKIYGTNILISESTLKALKGRFACRFVDLVRVKGKTKPVSIYEPIMEGQGPASLQKDLEEFQHAMDLYREKAFDQSLLIIKQLQMNNPTALYKLYIERINHFRHNSPPAAWDGVYTATSK